MAKLCPAGKAAAKKNFLFTQALMQIFGHLNIVKVKWVEVKKQRVVL